MVLPQLKTRNNLYRSQSLVLMVKTFAPTLIRVWGLSFSTVVLLLHLPSAAQQPVVPPPSQAPIELSLLAPGAAPDDGLVITSNTLSQQQLTVPSLWRAKDQFGGNVLSDWLAYPGFGTDPARIDLVVNRENWNFLDYIQRYEFVNNFGAVARDYGYNLRVFNYQQELLATYTCNFQATPSQCSIQLDAMNKGSVRGTSPGGMMMRSQDFQMPGSGMRLGS